MGTYAEGYGTLVITYPIDPAPDGDHHTTNCESLAQPTTNPIDNTLIPVEAE